MASSTEGLPTAPLAEFETERIPLSFLLLTVFLEFFRKLVESLVAVPRDGPRISLLLRRAEELGQEQFAQLAGGIRCCVAVKARD